MVSCFSSGATVDGTGERGRPRVSHQRHHRGRGATQWEYGSDEDDVLDEARGKIGTVLKGSAAGQSMSPRGLFDYLDSEGIGEVQKNRVDVSLKSFLD